MPLPDVGSDWCATEYFPPFLTVQAEAYDTRITGPRKEERLRRIKEQMRSIRGFKGEWQTLRGEGPVSSSLGQRQLCDSISDFQRQLDNSHHVTGVASRGDHVTERDESYRWPLCDWKRWVRWLSCDRAVRGGRVVTLGLTLRDRTIRKQFYTTDSMQVTKSPACYLSLLRSCVCQLTILHIWDHMFLPCMHDCLLLPHQRSPRLRTISLFIDCSCTCTKWDYNKQLILSTGLRLQNPALDGDQSGAIFGSFLLNNAILLKSAIRIWQRLHVWTHVHNRV